MPAKKKIETVEELRVALEAATAVITTDFSGLPVLQITALRKALREKGVRFRVIKNTLAHLAADAAGKPEIKSIVEGPTGIAFGYGDPTEPAKALAEFIRDTKSSLRIKGGVVGQKTLTASEVDYLATLPSKEELIAKLMGQLQGTMTGLAVVLNAPISGLARVLQRHLEAQTQ